MKIKNLQQYKLHIVHRSPISRAKLERSDINTALTERSMLIKCGTTLASKPDYTEHIVGISHFEHRWSEETRDVLRDAFENQHGQFFRTDKR